MNKIFCYFLIFKMLWAQPYKIFIIKKEKIAYITNGKIVKKFKIGIGKEGYETPSGIYVIKNKIENPAWGPSPTTEWLSEEDREYLKKNKAYPYGHPRNPLRYYWIGLKKKDGEDPRIGIHGIVNNNGIGKASSHGCIRATKECLEFIVENIPIGSEVIIK